MKRTRAEKDALLELKRAYQRREREREKSMRDLDRANAMENARRRIVDRDADQRRSADSVRTDAVCEWLVRKLSDRAFASRAIEEFQRIYFGSKSFNVAVMEICSRYGLRQVECPLYLGGEFRGRLEVWDVAVRRCRVMGNPKAADRLIYLAEQGLPIAECCRQVESNYNLRQPIFTEVQLADLRLGEQQKTLLQRSMDKAEQALRANSDQWQATLNELRAGEWFMLPKKPGAEAEDMPEQPEINRPFLKLNEPVKLKLEEDFGPVKRLLERMSSQVAEAERIAAKFDPADDGQTIPSPRQFGALGDRLQAVDNIRKAIILLEGDNNRQIIEEVNVLAQVLENIGIITSREQPERPTAQQINRAAEIMKGTARKLKVPAQDEAPVPKEPEPGRRLRLSDESNVNEDGVPQARIDDAISNTRALLEGVENSSSELGLKRGENMLSAVSGGNLSAISTNADRQDWKIARARAVVAAERERKDQSSREIADAVKELRERQRQAEQDDLMASLRASYGFGFGVPEFPAPKYIYEEDQKQARRKAQAEAEKVEAEKQEIGRKKLAYTQDQDQRLRDGKPGLTFGEWLEDNDRRMAELKAAVEAKTNLEPGKPRRLKLGEE